MGVLRGIGKGDKGAKRIRNGRKENRGKDKTEIIDR
jgi:hypothetical protein